MSAEHPKPPPDGPQTADIQPFKAHRGIDRSIAEIAETQHGVVNIEQLSKAGLSKSAIHQRAAVGRLHRVHIGVYSVGHRPLTPNARKMAAVLACGPDSVLSHRTAAMHWGLRPPYPGAIDVTAPNRRGRIPAGIRAHRNGSLRPEDRVLVDGVPCTSVARTLLDFAAVSNVFELRRAISEAEVRRIFNLSAVEAIIERGRGRRGVARLRMLISELDSRTAKSRSWLERRFLAMCRRAAIPLPEVNCTLDLGGEQLKPDFLWREARLIVETDGRETHDTASAFERDRRRDQAFSVANWQVIRFTWRQVVDEPTRVGRTISTVLGRRA